MFLDDGQQFERHAARLLCPGFPLFHGAFARVEVAGEDRLADLAAFPELLDLRGVDRRRDRQARLVETAHRSLVDRSHAEHAGGAAMDRLEGITLEFGRHGKSPPAP